MESQKQRSFFTLATVVAVLNVSLIIFCGFTNASRSRATDFGQYYIVGERLRVGDDIYALISYDRDVNPSGVIEGGGRTEHSGDTHRMPNPPPLALLMRLLTFVDYPMAWWSVCLSSLLAIAGATYRVSQELCNSKPERATWVAVSLGSFAALASGLLNHIETLVWVLLVWGWLALRRGNERSAGVLWGLVGCFKLFPLAFIPMLFFAGYRRAGVFATLSAVGVLGISFALVGQESALVFVRDVLPQSARYRYSVGNISGLSLLARVMPGEMALVLTSAFLVWTAFLCRRHRSPDQVFVLGSAGALLCSPLSWTYYLIAALPAVMIVAAWEREQLNTKARLAFLLATLVYWPWILGGWLREPWLPEFVVVALNYVPTLGLLVLWKSAQRIAPRITGTE